MPFSTSLPAPDPAQVESLRRRCLAVQARIAAAQERRGRTAPVRLVGVTKTFPAAVAAVAFAAGLEDLGESRPQELRDKAPQLPDAIRWHFIGPLQRNKVKYVVGRAALIHSLDSLPLAEALQKEAERRRCRQALLVQVNVSHEAEKQGFSPEQAADSLQVLSSYPNLQIRGLMTIPSASPDPESTREFFVALRLLSESLRKAGRLAADAIHLSMGMTQDFEVAVEEGATLVRVGTALFGPRPLTREPSP